MPVIIKVCVYEHHVVLLTTFCSMEMLAHYLFHSSAMLYQYLSGCQYLVLIVWFDCAQCFSLSVARATTIGYVCVKIGLSYQPMQGQMHCCMTRDYKSAIFQKNKIKKAGAVQRAEKMRKLVLKMVHANFWALLPRCNTTISKHYMNNSYNG